MGIEKKWQERRVLVTGAGGFVGSHLTERLVNLGARVKAFVHYNSRNDWGMIELIPIEVRNEIEVLPADLRNPEAVRKAVSGVEYVFHLGALIGIPYSFVNPRDVIDTNIQGTLNVLLAARDEPVQSIVQTSTSEVYGTAQYVPMDEKHPLNPQSPYAASKVGADKLAESFYKSFAVPVAIVRPFNIYGPRQSARAIVPTIITQALSRDKILLGRLDTTRDLTFVEDAVEGFISLADQSAARGEVVNIGSSSEITIEKLAEKITSLLRKSMEITRDSNRLRPDFSEVERLCADTTKARELIDWDLRVDLDTGLKRTIDWISGHLERYKAGIYNI